MATAFTNMLSVLYQRVGDTASYEAVDGSAPRQVQVKFDLQGNDMLDGGHIADHPTLRIAASDAPGGVTRGDAFTIGGVTYQAREPGLPVLDGAEYQVNLSRASAR